MMFLLYTLHVLICLFLIAVVLLQQGKGADLSVFGGGGTQTAFGARGAATVLHKLTVGSFIGFIITTLAIGIVQKQEATSIIQGLSEKEAATASANSNGTDGAEEEAAGALPTDEPATDDAAAGDAATGDTAAEDAATSPEADVPEAAGEAPAEADEAATDGENSSSN